MAPLSDSPKPDRNGEPGAGERLQTVRVPENLREVFLRAQEYVERYFGVRTGDPRHGTVEFGGERYIMVRAASMSVEFFDIVASLYRDRGAEEARSVANLFLFDIAHALGKADAKAFHSRMGVSDPLEKLSAGPVHFAHAGWAFVDILPESRPSPDENYFLIYDHPYSFEADAWLRRGRRAGFPVCVMNCGYSSGWCEESFGVSLVAAEVECRARGDARCRFIMAPPSRIEEHLRRYGAAVPGSLPASGQIFVPEFFRRKRLEDALRANEAKYRRLVENLPEGYFFYARDTGGTFTYVSPSITAVLGFTPEEFCGHYTEHLTDSEVNRRALRHTERSIRGEEQPPYEIECRDRQRRIRRLEVTEVPIRDEGGRVVAVEGIAHDITGRRQAEERLERQSRFNRLRAEIWRLAADQSLADEALIQRLLAALGAELGVSRACFNRVAGQELRCDVEWCAPGVLATLGTTGPLFLAERATSDGLAVLTRESAAALAPPELRPAVEEFLAGLTSVYGVQSLAIMPCRIGGALEAFVTLDVCAGSPRPAGWTEEEKSLVSDAVLVIAQTIARRRAERALRESEERHRALIEHIPAITYTASLDAASTTLFVSPQIEEILGVTPADYAADPDLWRKLLHPEDRDRVMGEVIESHRTGQPLISEYRMVRPDGRAVWIRDEGGFVRDEAGHPLFLQGVMVDITTRKEAEAALRDANRELERRVLERTAELEARHAELLAANRELERLHRAKDEFVAMISHELRTPLVTGLGYVELLLEGHLGPVTPETAAGMQVALRNLKRLSALIDDILSYHSIIRHDRRAGPVLTSFAPAEMIRECREEFLVRSGRDGATVMVEAAPTLPAVRADEDMIRRVISNLLDNADRHAGTTARIRLGAAPAEPGDVRFWVSDDGAGMSPEVQTQVFEPFVKLSGKREGAGLGLAIVRSVLEAHGSAPHLLSAPGRGTEVSFALPAVPKDAPAAYRREGEARQT